MTKSVGIVLCAWSLVAGIPAAASAESDRVSNRIQRRAEQQQRRVDGRSEQRQVASKWKRWEHDKGVPAEAVPELDPGLAASAAALLIAATALLSERRRNARI